jgi:hypothetical protein
MKTQNDRTCARDSPRSSDARRPGTAGRRATAFFHVIEIIIERAAYKTAA